MLFLAGESEPNCSFFPETEIRSTFLTKNEAIHDSLAKKKKREWHDLFFGDLKCIILSLQKLK